MNKLRIFIVFTLFFLTGNAYSQPETDKSSNPTHKVKYEHLLHLEFNGSGPKYFEGSQPLSKAEFANLLKSNPAAYRQYKSGKNLNAAANIIGIPAGIVFGGTLGVWVLGTYEPSASLLLYSGIAWAGGIALHSLGRIKIRRAVKTYNSSGDLGYRLNLNENGLGLVLQF